MNHSWPFLSKNFDQGPKALQIFQRCNLSVHWHRNRSCAFPFFNLIEIPTRGTYRKNFVTTPLQLSEPPLAEMVQRERNRRGQYNLHPSFSDEDNTENLCNGNLFFQIMEPHLHTTVQFGIQTTGTFVGNRVHHILSVSDKGLGQRILQILILLQPEDDRIGTVLG